MPEDELETNLSDADSTTDSQGHSPNRSSVALLPTTDEPFHMIELEEVQPAIDDVPNIPDDPTIPPMPVAAIPNFENVSTPIPPMPDATVPNFDVPPPVPDKSSAVHETNVSAADVPLPTSDDRTLPPPTDEWVQVQDGDAPNRKSYADTELSPPESEVAGDRSSLITRADLLRQQADEEDRIRAELENELKKFKEEGNVKDAFLIKPKIDEAENRAERLHAKAARRYFHGMLRVYFCSRFILIEVCAAHNEKSSPTTIDVRKLKVPEAIRRTEQAITDVLLQSGTVLRVVTDGGVKNSTHLAIIGAMQE